MNKNENKDLKNLAKTIEKMTFLSDKLIKKNVFPVINNITKIVTYINSPKFNDTIRFISEIPDFIERFQVNTSSDYGLMAEYGWYIDSMVELNFIAKLAKMLRNNEVDKVDQLLINHYNLKLKNIENFLIKNYPHRTQIIKEIFYAHKNKKYNLTIPCIYTQIDGICLEFTEKKFFTKAKYDLMGDKKWYPEFIENIKNFNSEFVDFILVPLITESPINAMEDRLNNFEIKLNRHKVIHGSSTDYGNEINSIKSIALLFYVSETIKYYSSKD